jgi:hypothetical protein
MRVKVPAPAETQPAFGAFHTSIEHQTNAQNFASGGHFSKGHPKDFIEQEIFEHKDVPCPGEYQPQFAAWTTSIAYTTNPNRNKSTGKFANSKVMNLTEREAHSKRSWPAPVSTC